MLLTRTIFNLGLGVLVLSPLMAWGQILVDEGNEKKPKAVGEKAAREYFRQRKSASEGEARSSQSPRREVASGGGARHMGLYLGRYLNDKQYRWGGRARDEDVGETIFGLSYRIGEWMNSMDLYFRGEIQTYDLDNEQPTKLSLMPVIGIPDAKSGFPLYFGAGVGLGLFFSQLDDESDLSLDYVLLGGVRFPELFESWGLNFEVGYKGHFHLLSSGQFEGVYYALGGVFEF